MIPNYPKVHEYTAAPRIYYTHGSGSASRHWNEELPVSGVRGIRIVEVVLLMLGLTSGGDR